MAGWYYLVSQLPSFQVRGNSPLPITEAYAQEVCTRCFGEKERAVLRGLSLEPPRRSESTGSVLVDAWNERERSLRLALARLRAAKLKKEFAAVPVQGDILQVARTAFGMGNPLSAELYLDDMRAAFLEDMTPTDYFSTDAVYAYILKLKLAARIRKFNEEAGMASYHKIYDQILGESR